VRSTNNELGQTPVTLVRYGLMLRQIANGGAGLWMWWAPVSRHAELPKRRCPPAWWLAEELHIGNVTRCYTMLPSSVIRFDIFLFL